MHSGFKNKANNMERFSLAPDKLLDVTDTVLLFLKSQC